MRKNLIVIASAVLSVLLIAFVATALLKTDNLFSLKLGAPEPSATQYITPTTKPTDAPTPEPTPEPTSTPEPIPPYTDIVIGFAGDTIAHGKVLENAYTGEEDGKLLYSFDHIFKYIKPALEYPDLMVVNLESPIAGQEAGYSKSPGYNFNFPDEIVPALQNAGVDMVLNANNHAYDKGFDGVLRTIDVLDSYSMLHTGTWKSPEDKAIAPVYDIQGIKVGIVSTTYFLNGHEAGIAQEVLDYMFCFTDNSDVQEQINLCRENGAEIIIVTPHMGLEYYKYASSYAKKQGTSYIKMGADVVIAHHPHVLQPSELIQVELEDGTTNEGVCFWSIGNFMSNQATLQGDFSLDVRETGVIVYVNIRKDNTTGEVEIQSLEYLPTYMLRRADLNPRVYAVLPAGNEIDFYAAPYNELPLTRGIMYALGRAWDLATSQVGTEYATPLSSIPTRDSDEILNDQ